MSVVDELRVILDAKYIMRTALWLILFALLAGCGTDSNPLTDTKAPVASTATKSGATSDEATNQRQVVSLTAAALAKVRDFQQQAGKRFLRVGVKSGGPTGFMYELHLDDRYSSADDYLYEQSGVSIVVYRKSALFIEGTSIDWQVLDDGQQGFHFDNPQALKQQ